MEYQLFMNLEEIQTLGKNPEEIKVELYDLWVECFGDTKSYADFYFEWKLKDNRILTIYKKDKPSAMLHLNPYTLCVQGKQIPANYIVGVATRKEDRRQGLMKRLLEASLNQMYVEQMPFTYLMPAAEAIYLPFDFRIVYKQENWDKSLFQGGKFKYKEKLIDKEIRITAVKADETEKINELIDFSNHLLEQEYNIYTKRTEYYYQRIIHEMESTGGSILLCYKEEQIIGYASYMADNEIHITESIFLKEEKDDFFYAVAQYFKEGDVYKVSPDKTFVPTIMTRIVNWRVFAEGLTSRENIELTIQVKDLIIKENNGIYKLKMNTKRCLVEKLEREQNKLDINMDIADLTRLFFGSLSLEELKTLIKPERLEAVLELIKKINTYDRLFINDVV